MAYGPTYSQLPLAAATATRPATRYVDEASWTQLIGNFSLMQDNVNGNLKNLTNLTQIASVRANFSGAGSRGVVDVAGQIAFTNNANMDAVDHAASSWTTEGGGVIGWNKVVGSGDFSLVCLSGAGGDGGFSFWDRNNLIGRIAKAGTFYLPSSPQLSTTAGATSAHLLMSSLDGGNTDILQTYRHRLSTGSGWSTERWIIERKVDATAMGQIYFHDDGLILGGGGVPVVTIDPGGATPFVVSNSFNASTGAISVLPQNAGATEGGHVDLMNHGGGWYTIDVFNDTFRIFHHTGAIGIQIGNTGRVTLNTPGPYAGNSAAVAAGLTSGQTYYSSDGILRRVL